MLASMIHVFPAKKNIYSYVFSTGLTCAVLASIMLASMTHASLQIYYNNSYDETFLLISRE
jgi:hypothetical protein